jgi:hypothetical protein
MSVVKVNQRGRKHKSSQGVLPSMGLTERCSDAKASDKTLLRYSEGCRRQPDGKAPRGGKEREEVQTMEEDTQWRRWRGRSWVQSGWPTTQLGLVLTRGMKEERGTEGVGEQRTRNLLF